MKAEVAPPERRLPDWMAPATDWLPRRRLRAWQLGFAALLFPIVLLSVASLRPRSWAASDSALREYGVHILSLHWPMFAVLVIGVLHLALRLPLSDLGLRWRDLHSALAGTAACWILVQVFAAFFAIGHGSFAWAWKSAELAGEQAVWRRDIVAFFANTFATGLNEETFFRGFLFAHLFVLFLARTSGARAFAASAALAALAFALCHLQFAPAAIAFLAFGGCVAAAFYARTGNLLLLIGVHGLFNAPLALIAVQPNWGKIAVLAAMAILFASWPILVRAARTGD